MATVVAACQAHYQAHIGDCSGFAEAVATAVGVTLIPAGRTFDSRLSGRPAGIILISRAAATPTLRAYQSPVEATGIRWC